jgi:hypothetical protein
VDEKLSKKLLIRFFEEQAVNRNAWFHGKVVPAPMRLSLLKVTVTQST